LKKEPSPTREKRVSVISLDDQRIVGSIFKALCHSSATHQDLRRQIFRHMAKSTRLQRMFLDVVSGHPDIQRAVLQELAKNPQLKRKLVVVAHEHKQSQVTSHS
jgi:hypothetical protein